jgi:hypothetical protein
MRAGQIESFHGAMEVWNKYYSSDWITTLLHNDSIYVKQGNSDVIRDAIRNKLLIDGWILDAPLSADFGLTITGLKKTLGFQIQTGNISRAAYDYLKLQYLYEMREIECACLVVPSSSAAGELGGNLAHFGRLREEMKLFDRIISIPLLLVSFD